MHARATANRRRVDHWRPCTNRVRKTAGNTAAETARKTSARHTPADSARKTSATNAAASAAMEAATSASAAMEAATRKGLHLAHGQKRRDRDNRYAQRECKANGVLGMHGNLHLIP
jgi:hypothetical protein